MVKNVLLGALVIGLVQVLSIEPMFRRIGTAQTSAALGVAIRHATRSAYEVLGINPGVNEQQIKEAFRQKAMKCHPDNGGSHEEFCELKKAFDQLQNKTPNVSSDVTQANDLNVAIWHATAAMDQANEVMRQFRADGKKMDEQLRALSEQNKRDLEEMRKARVGRERVERERIQNRSWFDKIFGS